MILPPVELDITASWFNQYVIKPLQGEKCSSYLSLVDLSIVLPRVFFFAALRPRTNLRLLPHARTYTNVTVVIDVLVVVYNINVGESGYAISSWSASARYSA